MSCKIHNNSEYDISEMKPLIRNLYGFAKNEFGLKSPPSINFVSDQTNHPMLGKTAHYDPSSMEVTVYVDGRHPKDMMRSIAHELVHHHQNERGMFDDEHIAGEGYAQKDPHLRKMEEEAYLKGNMCFRDWEDKYKTKNKDIFYERRIYKMSTKKWKNKELNNLLNERWGFSMDLGKLNENSKPDYIDIDGDGDKEESMKDAAKDKSEEAEEEVNEMRIVATGEGAYHASPQTIPAGDDDEEDSETEEEEGKLEEAPKSIGDVVEMNPKLREPIQAELKDLGLTLKSTDVDQIVNAVLKVVQSNSTTRPAASKIMSSTLAEQTEEEK
tara:strand:- start:2833 stop:3813 length:981 start_codon:yes stop_codon:yes gene_type:complete